LFVEKWEKLYPTVRGLINARMSIALVRATNRCIRGSRTRIYFSSPILQGKVEQLALKLGIETFLASDGWFDSWKKMNSISLRTSSGESGYVLTKFADD